MTIVQGQERACIEGCRGNTECVLEMLGSDYGGHGGFSVVFGNGLPLEELERLQGDILIVGPCSIHNLEDALEYGMRLKELANKMEESCFLVMRAYVEKPRTQIGWKGLLHDPHLNGSEDIACGLSLSRSLLVQLAEMDVPTATEFLTPTLAPYIEDLITWGCIGARTSASQPHRLLASSLPMPIGFKNTVDGNISCAVNGALVAKSPHAFPQISEDGKLCHIKSLGNPHTHIVLRGGSQGPNYSSGSIQQVLGELRKQELPPRVLVDCSHDNCEGKYFQQRKVFQSVLEQIRGGNSHILGMMLESHLDAGAQIIPASVSELQKGVSITDPCLDWSETEELICSIASANHGVMSCTQS